MPSALHFDDVIRNLFRRPVAVNENYAGNAAHPLALVGGVPARAHDQLLEGLLAWQVDDLAQAERVDGGRRDLAGERCSRLLHHPGREHLVRPAGDALEEDVARDLEAEDEGLVADLVGRVPRTGDTIDWQGYRFTVLRSSPRRAERIEIRRVEKTTNAARAS